MSSSEGWMSEWENECGFRWFIRSVLGNDGVLTFKVINALAVVKSFLLLRQVRADWNTNWLDCQTCWSTYSPTLPAWRRAPISLPIHHTLVSTSSFQSFFLHQHTLSFKSASDTTNNQYAFLNPPHRCHLNDFIVRFFISPSHSS